MVKRKLDSDSEYEDEPSGRSKRSKVTSDDEEGDDADEGALADDFNLDDDDEEEENGEAEYQDDPDQVAADRDEEGGDEEEEEEEEDDEELNRERTLSEESDFEELMEMPEVEREMEHYRRNQERERKRERAQALRAVRRKAKSSGIEDMEMTLDGDDDDEDDEDAADDEAEGEDVTKDEDEDEDDDDGVYGEDDIMEDDDDDDDQPRRGVFSEMEKDRDDRLGQSDESDADADDYDQPDRDEDEFGEGDEDDESEKKPDLIPQKAVGTQTKVDLAAIKKCFIRRNAFGEKFEEPYFDRWCIGMFARAPVGSRKGENVYAIGVIESLHKHPKMYRFMHSTTDKLIGLRHGMHLKKFRLDQLSNSSPTEEEFQAWEAALDKMPEEHDKWLQYQEDKFDKAKSDEKSKEFRSDTQFHKDMTALWEKMSHKPTKEELMTRRSKAIEEAATRNYTAEDLKKMAESKKWGPVRYVPNIPRELIMVQADIENAEAKENHRMVAKLKQRKAELRDEQRKRHNRSGRLKPKTRDISQKWKQKDVLALQEAGRKINAENRKRMTSGEPKLDAFERVLTRPAVQRFGKDNQKAELARLESSLQKPKKEVAEVKDEDDDDDELAHVASAAVKDENDRINPKDVAWQLLARWHLEANFDEHAPPPPRKKQIRYDWYQDERRSAPSTISFADYMQQRGSAPGQGSSYDL